MSDTGPLIIVGTGLAGYNLAKEVRKLDNQRELILLTADDGRFYSKPLLSTGFAKGKQADELAMQDATAMAAQLNAQIMPYTRVLQVDPQSRTIRTQNGELHYGDLVLACGAHARPFPLAEEMHERVLSINDLGDYGRFREALQGRKRIAIIGAGLIGSEFANDLALGGLEVQVIAPDEQLMPGLIPDQIAAPVQAALQELGVQFHLGRSVVAVHPADAALSLELDDGSRIEADQVLSAIGLIANTTLAHEAGLLCGRGIQVDRYLRTSDPHVYALGDCAEVTGMQLMYVMPLMSCARALARTLAQDPTEVSYPVMPVMVKTPACPLVVAPPVTTTNGLWTVSGEGQNMKALFHDADGMLHGYALTGTAVSEKLQLNRQLPAWLV
ncbi:NAD(P)/FAD-dependent oxidoreductase [Halopseudomonas salina]|uniref:Pyridine nucleotide-disulfide oxidoreductase n=1 Tax=Halopseudomonas salina TaxID=1323744 RepID=A0ABQ1PD81_9GAMM|nr:FAD-dependent oxidoreductase [Halopseudomonas salina]GGC94950.1 pyridine nucleotide-disulfide oxidoreductase [Halopseudomonas salina]